MSMMKTPLVVLYLNIIKYFVMGSMFMMYVCSSVVAICFISLQVYLNVLFKYFCQFVPRQPCFCFSGTGSILDSYYKRSLIHINKLHLNLQNPGLVLWLMIYQTLFVTVIHQCIAYWCSMYWCCWLVPVFSVQRCMCL